MNSYMEVTQRRVRGFLDHVAGLKVRGLWSNHTLLHINGVAYLTDVGKPFSQREDSRAEPDQQETSLISEVKS